jgi:hypothetical protein
VHVHEMVCHEHRSLIHFYAYMKNMNCVEFSRLMIILTLNLNSQRSANTSHECQVIVFSKGLVKSTTTTSSSSSASLSHLLAKLHLPSSRPPSATLLPELLDDVPSLDDVTAPTLGYGGLY